MAKEKQNKIIKELNHTIENGKKSLRQFGEEKNAQHNQQCIGGPIGSGGGGGTTTQRGAHLPLVQHHRELEKSLISLRLISTQSTQQSKSEQKE